jgi:glycosyltransferase involved in cell wall biosynthesis
LTLEILPEPARRTIPEFSVLEMGEVSAEGVAEALDNLYRDPQRRQHLAQAAHQAALNPDYAWDAIAERFDDLFAELAK